MWIALRDTLLSFCPEAFRREHGSYSPPRTLIAAKWLGLTQFFAFAFLLGRSYLHYVQMRAHQWSVQMQGSPELVQSGTAVIVALEFLLHPLSLVLLYFSGEGLVRFSAAVISSEVVGSLPLVLILKTAAAQQRRKEARRLQSLPPDRVEHLADNRIRISSAELKPTWDANITLVMDGVFYELETQSSGTAPYLYVYELRPAPVGKVMRKVEQYPGA